MVQKSRERAKDVAFREPNKGNNVRHAPEMKYVIPKRTRYPEVYRPPHAHSSSHFGTIAEFCKKRNLSISHLDTKAFSIIQSGRDCVMSCNPADTNTHFIATVLSHVERKIEKSGSQTIGVYAIILTAEAERSVQLESQFEKYTGSSKYRSMYLNDDNDIPPSRNTSFSRIGDIKILIVTPGCFDRLSNRLIEVKDISLVVFDRTHQMTDDEQYLVSIMDKLSTKEKPLVLIHSVEMNPIAKFMQSKYTKNDVRISDAATESGTVSVAAQSSQQKKNTLIPGKISPKSPPMVIKPNDDGAKKHKVCVSDITKTDSGAVKDAEKSVQKKKNALFSRETTSSSPMLLKKPKSDVIRKNKVCTGDDTATRSETVKGVSQIIQNKKIAATSVKRIASSPLVLKKPLSDGTTTMSIALEDVKPTCKDIIASITTSSQNIDEGHPASFLQQLTTDIRKSGVDLKIETLKNVDLRCKRIVEEVDHLLKKCSCSCRIVLYVSNTSMFHRIKKNLKDISTQAELLTVHDKIKSEGLKNVFDSFSILSGKAKILLFFKPNFVVSIKEHILDAHVICAFSSTEQFEVLLSRCGLRRSNSNIGTASIFLLKSEEAKHENTLMKVLCDSVGHVASELLENKTLDH